MGLRWFRTSTNRADDFTASDPEHPEGQCRVYRTATGTADRPWFWMATDGTRHLGEGDEPTLEAAKARAEETYRNASHATPAVARTNAPLQWLGRPPRTQVLPLAARYRHALRILSTLRDGD
jgi:hypothetical protein